MPTRIFPSTVGANEARGRADGLFRDDVSPLELHWDISASSFFNVSNQATFSRIFGSTLYTVDGQRSLRDHLVEMVVGLALKPGHPKGRTRGVARP